MNLLKSNDPAPSRLYYKINRLFYRLWFRLVLVIVFSVVSILLSKKFLYKDIDLNAEIRFLSEESSAIYKGLTELSITRILVKGAQESLKKEIINLIQELKEKFGMALIFISHDLGVVSQVSKNIIVMKRGEIIETGKTYNVLNKPKKLYTKTLISCLKNLNTKRKKNKRKKKNHLCYNWVVWTLV